MKKNISAPDDLDADQDPLQNLTMPVYTPLTVSSRGRVTIPKNICESREIEEGDTINVYLGSPHSENQVELTAVVQTNRQITIQSDIRHKYDIEQGDRYHIGVAQTEDSGGDSE